MSLQANLSNFISGTAGAFVGLTQVTPEIVPASLPNPTSTLIAGIITVVSGLLTTVLTNLFKKWMKNKSETEKIE